ncbi:hypothetical protein [Crenothrix sp.]|uniref:hypothetical protein n=1 Tax=Crenothrix sp. TaxID=3100433 RepID=UPI00374DA12C
MQKNFNRKLIIVTLLSTFIPATGSSTPRVMLEKAQTYALDNQVKGFQVPTIDNTGKIKYYDISIKLTVKNDGSFNPLPSFTAKPSISISTRSILPGTYKEVGGDVCKVTNIMLSNGRVQSFFTCPSFEFSLATGPITVDHPDFAALTAAEIQKKPDVTTQTWGAITNGHFDLTTCSPYSGTGFLDVGGPIGAKTDGKTLVLSAYSSPAFANNSGSFICSATFIKQS